MPAEGSGEGRRRVLGLATAGGGPSRGTRLLVLLGALIVLGTLLALSDPEASLRHLRAGFLSGSTKGNYFTVVDRIAIRAARRKGRITNVSSAGSVENVRRLIAARSGCTATFALVQEGMDWPEGHGLELVGRLTRPESLVVLGRNADRIASPRDLQALRIGIGPEGSGTAFLMRGLLASLSPLGLRISTQPVDEQIRKLDSGELDLGAMVTDDDAEQLQQAVTGHKLQILDLPRAEAMARAMPFLHVSRIEAGHFDVVSALPPTDKAVLQVDTLIVSNGCASRSTIQGLIGLFAEADPLFLKHNRETANLSGLVQASAARSYYDSGAPDLVGVYAPWVFDIMPTASWVQLALGVSILFNVMGAANRYRLWRLDNTRVRLEGEVTALFGPGITVGEIARAPHPPGTRAEELQQRVRGLVDRLAELYETCRRQSLSVLVPMGGEMAYRYQEALVTDLLQALREFDTRLQAGRDRAAS